VPSLSGTQSVQRPDLGDTASQYFLNQDDLIWDKVMPPLPVATHIGEYPIIPIEALLTEQATKRAPRAQYNSGDYETETGEYKTSEDGWAEPLDDVERKMYEHDFDAEEIAAQRATDIVLRNLERYTRDFVFDSNNAIHTQSLTKPWSDAANATPKADIVAARKDMKIRGGIRPNTLVMSEDVLDVLMETKEIKDRTIPTKDYGASSVDDQLAYLANYFRIQNILIGGALTNKAAKGKKFEGEMIWTPDKMALLHVNFSMNIRAPQFGRTFIWKSDGNNSVVIDQYRKEDNRSDMFRARNYTGRNVIYKGGNYLLSNVY